jgi:hypothetical protein
MEIFSPSRVMFRSGVNIDEGLIDGIKSKLRAVGQTAKNLANSVIRPTVALPAAIGATVQTAAASPLRSALSADTGREFGPYKLDIDGQVITEFAVNAITGNPKIVHKSGVEGARQAKFA